MRVWLNEVATHLKQILYCEVRGTAHSLYRNTPEIRRLRESHLLHHPAKSISHLGQDGTARGGPSRRAGCNGRGFCPAARRFAPLLVSLRPRPRLRAPSSTAGCLFATEFYSRLPLRHKHRMLMSGRLMTASPLHGVFRAGLPAVAGRGAVRSNRLSGCPALNAVGKRPDASVRSKRVGPVASSLLDAGTDAWEYADVGVGYGTQSFDSAFPTAGIMAAEAWSATVACAVTAAQTSS